mmetsp:Transcript_4718/g.8395  ORF Transcript_4718/g.8395 Transcript_4718/m.8395 type:complete len:120 (+) Transcript_4718:328-687(+)
MSSRVRLALFYFWSLETCKCLISRVEALTALELARNKQKLVGAHAKYPTVWKPPRGAALGEAKGRGGKILEGSSLTRFEQPRSLEDFQSVLLGILWICQHEVWEIAAFAGQLEMEFQMV